MEQIIKGMPDGAEAIQKNFAELMGKTQGQAAADMVKYSGGFSVAGVTIDNAPFSNPWYAGQVIVGTSEKTGAIVAYYFGGGMKVTAVSDGKIVGWRELATTDNAGLIDWQPNMDVKKGQLVTFKSLGTAKTGLLTFPIFMSLIDQNTGSSFPAADSLMGVSGKWRLTNKDAYSYDIGQVNFPYGFGMQLTRIGNMVIPYPNGRMTANVPSNTRMELAQEQVPVGLRIINRLGDNSGVTLRVVDEDGSDYVDYLISNNGKIYTTSLNGFPSGNYLRGFSTPYETGDSMIWIAGVPTV